MELQSSFFNSRYTVPIYLLFFFGLLCLTSGTQYWDQDESAYAGMALRMMETGNWVIPEFMWSAVHRKTPFIYWNMVLCYKAFGISEFSVRLPTMLLVTASIGLIYKIAGCFFDRKVALLSMVIMSTTLLLPMVGRIAVTDGTLFFFSILCVYTLFVVGNKRSWKLMLLFWLSFSMATLTKGPPILLFTCTLFGLIYLFHPDRKSYILFHPWFFIPLACIPFAWWGYISIQYDGGVFLTWLYEHYIIKRVNSSVFGQTGPPGTHLLFILISFLPYLLFFPGAFREAYWLIRKRDKTILLLLFWFLSAWFIYEISPSKLPAYTLLAHPPIAILVARYAFNSISKGILVMQLVLNLILALIIMICPIVVDLPQGIKISCLVVSSILVLSNVFGFIGYAKKSPLWFATGTAVLLQLAISIILYVNGDLLKHSSKIVARWCSQNAQDKTVLIGNDIGFPPSLPYYIKVMGNFPVSEYYASELVATFFEKDSSILVLRKNQAEAIIPFLSEYKLQIVPSFKLEGLEYYDYYLIQRSSSKTIMGELKLKSLSLPRSKEYFLDKIKTSPDLLKMIQEKAKVKNISIIEMIELDAIYLSNMDTEIYAYLKRMRASEKWLYFMHLGALNQGVPIEEYMLKQAQSIINLRNFQ